MWCVCLLDLLLSHNWYLSWWRVVDSVPLRGGSDMCVGISQAEEGSGGGGLE